MRPGDLITERFELERVAGIGGMGEVWKARDRHADRFVALKILTQGVEERFAREAQILSDLNHPHIVRYVAHGATPEGQVYLAMDWLEGCDLADRLAQGTLTPSETITLATIVAQALGFAHARDIVHRDLKPSNVFLPNGKIDRAMVLDFGLARQSAMPRVTRTGAMMGTPGYMAPEQARGSAIVDARADIFSLGVMIFECLTGQLPFAAHHLPAILAKILFENPPHVRERRADVSEALDDLVTRMLSKDPDDRPADGRAAVKELRALESTQNPEVETSPQASVRRQTVLRGGEQRGVALILVAPHPEQVAQQQAMGAEATFIAIPDDQELVKEAMRHGGRAERMLDGSVSVLLRETALATDLAAQAARCALALRMHGPGRRMAVAMGRSQTREAGIGSLGQTIEVVAKRLAGDVPVTEENAAMPILIDDVITGLLDARFDVREAEGGFSVLLGERSLGEGTRLLLGRATPCVGRDRELRILEQLLDECVDDGRTQAILVTAPAGVGKSRLTQEFIRRAREHSKGVRIWLGRGDALRAGSAFGLLAQVIRHATGVREGDPIEVRRDQLARRVAENVGPEKRAYVTSFLSELVGAPRDEDMHPLLVAARKDAQLMNEHMREAWLEFVAAESRATPVLMALEDLHWGDFPTVKFIDRVLRDQKSVPLFILALARPEVHEIFPRLWFERDVQEIRLKHLGVKPAERLVRHVLGDKASSDLIGKLVKLSDGNAFYLEELIRAAAAGKADDLPETVVAMVQSRLSELDEDARRILRTGSIFGEAFWTAAVANLLGMSENDTMLRDLLIELTDRELLVYRDESRFSSQREYAFRHALLREGAYSMVTLDDRVLGHRLAGEWLELNGERDPVVLAEHFEVGGDGGRAATYYLTAAEQAHLGGDTGTALAHTRNGLACTVSPELRIELLGLFCELHYYQRNEIPKALPYVEEVIRDAPKGSEAWIQGMFIKMLAGAHMGKPEEFGAALLALGQIEVQKGTEAALSFAYTVAAYILDVTGQTQMADAIMARLQGVANAAGQHDPRAMGFWYIMNAVREAYAHQDPWKARGYANLAMNAGQKLHYERMAQVGKSFLGMQTWFLGRRDEAERLLLEVTLSHEEMGFSATSRPICLAWVLAERGAFEEARRWAEVLIQYGMARHLTGDEGEGRWTLAEVLRRAGDLEGAEREIEAAIRLLRPQNVLDSPALLATLAKIRLAQGRVEEAISAASEGVAIYEKTGACAYFRAVFLRLVQVESFDAAGQRENACRALEKARAEVVANAAKIEDLEYRRYYLEEAIEPRRILELAHAWLNSMPGIVA